jgi:hypothetical protein
VVRSLGGSLAGAVAPGPSTFDRWGGAGSMLVGLGLGAVAWVASARGADDVAGEAGGSARRALDGCWALGAAALLLLAGRDLSRGLAQEGGGALRLLQLFTYNYDRPWPATIDFSAVLTAATAVGVLSSLLLIVSRRRRLVVGAFCSLGVMLCAWGVNVYLVVISPHWGQRETIEAYYRARSGPEEPIVAYQLNWKGENFYTGNRVPAFVSSGKRFKHWVDSQKNEGVRVMFFTTEHSRISSLKRELGDTTKFDLLTDEALNNKFVLARVEW